MLHSALVPPSAFLYHVTWCRNLPGIARYGLRPGAARCIGSPGYDFHCAQGVFLTEAESVPYWYHKARDFAQHGSDDYLGDGVVPVVLSVVRPSPLIPDDEAPYDHSWLHPGEIGPRQLLVWDGEGWVELKDLDCEHLDVERALEWEDDDNEMDEEELESWDGEPRGWWTFRPDEENPLLPDEAALAEGEE